MGERCLALLDTAQAGPLRGRRRLKRHDDPSDAGDLASGVVLLAAGPLVGPHMAGRLIERAVWLGALMTAARDRLFRRGDRARRVPACGIEGPSFSRRKR